MNNSLIDFVVLFVDQFFERLFYVCLLVVMVSVLFLRVDSVVGLSVVLPVTMVVTGVWTIMKMREKIQREDADGSVELQFNF